MHPAVTYAVVYGPDIARWLYKQKDCIPEYETIRHTVDNAITSVQGILSPSAALDTGAVASTVIDRMGPALVSLQNGQMEVIGLLHRQSDSLGQISAAVDHVLTGQQAIAGSLNMLTTLSMVGLGVSVLSHVALSFQLSAMTKRMNQIGNGVKQIQEMMAANDRAALAAGIVNLKNGLEILADKPGQAAGFFQKAIGDLVGSSAKYIALLQANFASPSSEYVWMLARHLATSALGETACHLQMSNPALAVKSLETALPNLLNHATVVFQRTVHADPTSFLIPLMAERGITLESVAELYRQASLAGVVGPEQRQSASELFERLHGRLSSIRNPRYGKAKAATQLVNKWVEASAAIEEVNRLQGLALAIKAYHSPQRSYGDLIAEILRTVEERQPAPGTCLAFFPNR